MRGDRGLAVVRAAAAAALAGAAVSFVVPALLGRFSGQFEDFSIQLRAGDAANHSADPYAGFAAQAVTTPVRGLGFDYPPLVAWAMRPLAAMPHNAAISLWVLVCLGCTVGGAVVVALTVLPRAWPRVELAVAGSILYAAATYNVWHGNANAVVFLLLALAFRSWVRGEEIRCGLLLAAGAALKLAPIVLLVLLLRRGWWRGAAAGVAAFAASLGLGALLLGVAPFHTWVDSVLPVLTRDDGWLQNQSWNAVVSRAVDRNIVRVDGTVPAAHALAVALGAAGLLLAAWVVSARPRPRPIRAAEFGVGVCAMLLAGTVTWYEHYVHLLIPLAAAIALIAERRPSAVRALVAAVAAALAVFYALVPEVIATTTFADVLSMRRGVLWWPWLQLFSLPALAAAGLLVALAGAVRSTSDRAPSASP